MSAHPDGTVARLRLVVVAVSSYFAFCWAWFADGRWAWGAVAIAAVGLFVGFELLRSLAPLLEEAAVTPPSPSSDVTDPPRILVDSQVTEPESGERQRARFLAALGHELRNPLNSVTGFSDMLLGQVDGDLNPEQERSVRTIRASAERLLRLVAAVVDRARLETGTLRLQQQWVAPEELISETISFVRARADGISVIGGVFEGLPRVFIDRHRTVQALVSLALLVARSSGTDITMRVAPPRRDQSGRFVQFDMVATLKDSSADTLVAVERLEQPLSQSDALGLEVAVARSVIETQGGRIWTEAGTAGSLRVCTTLPTSAR